MCVSVCVCLSVCLYVYVCMRLSACVSPSVCLFHFLTSLLYAISLRKRLGFIMHRSSRSPVIWSICLFVHHSVCLSVCLSSYLSLCLSREVKRVRMKRMQANQVTQSPCS